MRAGTRVVVGLRRCELEILGVKSAEDLHAAVARLVGGAAHDIEVYIGRDEVMIFCEVEEKGRCGA